MAYADKHPSKMYIFISGSSVPNANGTFDIFITYDEKLNIWRKIGETPYTYFSTVIAMNKYIYMFNTFPSNIGLFNVLLKTWDQPAELRTSRQDYKVIQIKDRIYAIGGHFAMTIAPAFVVEYLQQSKYSWSFASSLPQMSVVGNAVLEDKLYVVGFCNEFGKLKMRALIYNSIFDTWGDIIPPNIFRKAFALATYNEKIFILGGRSEDSCRALKAVECYNPIQKVWETCPDMIHPYIIPKAVVIGEKFIVYENYSLGEGIARFNASIWNEENMSWESDTNSKYCHLYKYTFCVIDDPFVLNELARENEYPGIEWINSPF